MPKRSTHTFASEENAQPELLRVYYCLYCGTRAMVVDGDITKLPTRKTDNAIVIETEKHTYKVMLEKGEHKLIKRTGGFERQYRMNCSKCQLPITYQSQPTNPDRVFLMPDSLSAQPKVSFGDDDVPDAIQPTAEGEVRVSFTIVSRGDRCSIKRVQGSSVEIEIKDVEADEKMNSLFSQYLQHILGTSKEGCTLDFGAQSRTKVFLIKNQTPSDVYKKLCTAAAAVPTKYYKTSGDSFLRGDI
eukprot:TRINITY_DN50761_c0_g1_i1.p1 TRINITY_DN50761_c0_g1~~TRINITY_DN50761_c0_g1_i1.p1  ORF type:complete len:244 (+),score=55.65 TRINITY_DN50761_c0_g1_i1:149-880(+)